MVITPERARLGQLCNRAAFANIRQCKPITKRIRIAIYHPAHRLAARPMAAAGLANFANGHDQATRPPTPLSRRCRRSAARSRRGPRRFTMKGWDLPAKLIGYVHVDLEG